MMTTPERKNAEEYAIRFEQAANQMEQELPDHHNPKLLKARIDASRSMAETLRLDLREDDRKSQKN